MAEHLPCFKMVTQLTKTSLPSTTSSHRLLLQGPKPTLVVSSSLCKQSYLSSVNADIEAHTKKAMPIRHPISVFEPMHHLTFAAPGSTAPAMCIAACELVGGRRDQAMSAASALHLVHAAAYSHEKLMSGGKPGTNGALVYGSNIELLTPDGMLPFAIELLASSSNDPAHLLRVVIEITRAAGSEGIVHGKFNELQYGYPSLHAKETWIDQVCKKKEGRLHACAGACGAILGGGSEEEIDRLRMFGLYIGTIQGIVNSMETKEDVPLIGKLRDLAFGNLEGFDEEKVGDVCSLVSQVESLEACLV